MKKVVMSLIIPFFIFADDFSSIILEKQNEAEEMLNDEFFRKTLKESFQRAKEVDVGAIQKRNSEILENTSPCFLGDNQKNTYEVMVFATFSMPITLWKEYSDALTKIGGTFALRGLPEDSFFKLTSEINHLKKSGVTAPILLDPKSFEKYEVETVPTIVLVKKEGYDKISGTVSLDYALDLFSREGSN